jgi:hypothetical protein
MSTTRDDRPGSSRQVALRDLEYAMSLAIQLLSELDRARAHVRTLKDDEDGRMIVTPSQARALNAAVENAYRSCREVRGLLQK